MKSTRLLSILDSYQAYEQLKKDMEDIFTQVTFDPVKDKVHVDEINANIKCFTSSRELEQEDFSKVCGFEVDLEKVDQRDLYDSLKELQDEERYYDGMEAAWNSDDACEAACNDPGLQFEQGNKVGGLWDDFETAYKTN